MARAARKNRLASMATSETPDMGSVAQMGEDIDWDRWYATAAEAYCEPCEALPEQVRSHSRGRPWRGLAVWHQVGPPGDLYIPRISAHTILVRRAAHPDRRGPVSVDLSRAGARTHAAAGRDRADRHR